MQVASRSLRLASRASPRPLILRTNATLPVAVPSGAAFSLYSYEICPYCAKVKAVARAASTPFAKVEVNPLTKSQIGFSTQHRKVPIAVFGDGRVVVESDRIIEELLATAELGADFASPDALEWSRWATEELALMMYPNLTRTFAECRQALAYADAEFGTLDALAIRTVGALGMSMAHSAVKKKYGIADERGALRERLATWETALGDGPFRAGRAAPDLGDVAVFGVLGAVKGSAVHDDIVRDSAKIAQWLVDVEGALPPQILVV